MFYDNPNEEDLIQKLLSSEYDDFNSTVLLESPFAETTRDGNGIIQLQIGLTETELLLAGHKPPPLSTDLELESLAPLPAVSLTVFRKKRRNTLKARFANGTVRYFELAAPHAREKFWRLWQDRLGQVTGSSLVSTTQSHTSVGSSLSSQSCRSPGDCTWQYRDVYLGEEFGQGETRVETAPTGTPHVPRVTEPEMVPPTRRQEKKTKVYPVNRFGAGIDERCQMSLYLPIQTSVTADQYRCTEFLMEGRTGLRTPDLFLATRPQLLFGLGLWRYSHAEACLSQLRKSSSSISLNRTTDLGGEVEVSKRLLVSGISCENLLRYRKQQRPWLGFWTPRLWYQPRSVVRSYKALRQQLQKVAAFIQDSKELESQFSKFRFQRRKKWNRKNFWTLPEKKVDWKTEIRMRLQLDISLSCWDFDSTVLAQEITLIYVDLLLRIPYREMAELVRERSSENSPNWRSLVAFSSRLQDLVPTELLRMETPQMRARLIARWVNVADKLHRLQNLEGVSVVLLGLQSPGVLFLEESWTYVRKHHSTKYRAILECPWAHPVVWAMCSPHTPINAVLLLYQGLSLHGYLPLSLSCRRLLKLCRLHREPRSRSYSDLVTGAAKCGPFFPCAGYIVAVFLGWTQYNHSLPYSGSDSGVEDEWSYWITGAASYRLPEHHLAREYLLKTRYLDQADNLTAARKLEPRVRKSPDNPTPPLLET